MEEVVKGPVKGKVISEGILSLVPSSKIPTQITVPQLSNIKKKVIHMANLGMLSLSSYFSIANRKKKSFPHDLVDILCKKKNIKNTHQDKSTRNWETLPSFEIFPTF